MSFQRAALLAHVARAPDVGDEVYRAFREDGYSPAASAGVIGNFQQESGLNAQEEGGGLDQGQGARYHPGSLQQQLDGIKAELNGPERGTREALRRAKSPQEAALIFSKRFERPGVPDNSNRERYAEEALSKYGHLDLAVGMGGSPSSSSVGTGAASQAEGDDVAQQQGLADVLRQALAPQQASSVAGTTLARPEASGGAQQAPGPRVPAPLQAPVTKSDVSSLLAAVAQLSPSTAPSPTAPAATSAKPVAAKASVGGGVADAKGGVGFTPAPGTVYDKGVLPQISRRANTLARALGLKLTGISGFRTPQHSVEVGGFADDPHTKAEASDTPGIEGVSKAQLNRYGLERPFPGAKEADHIQLLHSVNANGGY